MGLIKAIFNATSGALADQWVDFITCDSLSTNVLMAEGKRPNQAKSSNNKFSENIITNGSKINVADGQCMLICENGMIVDFCAEPGQYTYDSKIQPSLLGAGFKDLGATFQQIGKRFLAGGAPTDEQKVYFVNTKEIIGNKIGFGKIPFRDSEFQFTMKVQGFGQYSFKITNPLLFYKNVVGNIVEEYTKDELVSQMKSEVIAALQPALGKIAAQKISYDQLLNYPTEIGQALNDAMSTEWSEIRGIDIVKLAIESLTVDDASAKKIEQFQEARVLSNVGMAAGRMTAGSVSAMESAASNTSGAMNGFIGMGFAQNAMGQASNNINNMFAIGGQDSGMPQPPQPVGSQDKASDSWKCSCGIENIGAFCSECGAKKPQFDGWNCGCGAINKGKFCSDCGEKKPAGELLYKCDKCGWEPQDPKNPPKFCPECGDIFNENDAAK
jgi:membrane protease subunit (stomatin/prohibitin family)